jgi:hypothetical protein
MRFAPLKDWIRCHISRMRIHTFLFFSLAAAGIALGNSPMPTEVAAVQPPSESQSQVEQPKDSPVGQAAEAIEGYVRTQPVLPKDLEDYELRTLDVRKEVIFHVGDRTVTATVPVFVYVPVARPARKQALELLSEARVILIEVAARKTAPTGLELAAVRDLIERSLRGLETPTMEIQSNAVPTAQAPSTQPAQ